MEQKNNGIVVWRIIFTYILAGFHFDNHYQIAGSLGLSNGTYLGVEFFFMVSGYLLYEGFLRNSQKYSSGLHYLWARIKRLLPYYWGSYALLILWFIGTRGLKETLYTISYRYPELFALQCMGLNEGWINMNNSTWYISVMLLCGFVIYHCLVKWKDTFINFAAPIMIIVFYSYLYRNNGGVHVVTQTEGFYLNWALMRGMAAMCLGIFACRLNHAIRRKEIKQGFLKVLGGIGFVFILSASMVWGWSTRDYLYIIIESLCVALCFLPSDRKLYSNRLVQKWADITVCIYLTHMPFATEIFPRYIAVPESVPRKLLYLLLYYVIITLFGALFKWAVDGMMKKIRGCSLLTSKQ